MNTLDIGTDLVCPVKLPVTPPWRLPTVEYCHYFPSTKADLSEEVIRTIFYEHIECHSDSVHVFTDGSKSNAGVGYGVVFPTVERSGPLPSSASIFTAELHGILKATRDIILREESHFTLFCDSSSVLQSLSIFNSRHPLVLEILEWLLIAKRRGKEISFCWVPAHVGISGNERADALAKSATTMIVPRHFKLPYRDMFPVIKQKVQSQWQQCWESLQHTNTKMRRITSSSLPWQYTPMPRRWETALCRLRIGHTRLTHGYLMSADPQTYCMDCLVPLTVAHLLVECPSLGDERRMFLTYGKDRNVFKLDRVLGCDGDFSCKGLFGFLVHCNILGKL